RSAANVLAAVAAGPSRPDRPMGRPTMTSMTSSFAARAAIASRSPRPRGTVVSGLASRPSLSQCATPMRVDPKSTASRTPILNRRLRARKVSPRQRNGGGTVSPYATRTQYVLNGRTNRVKRRLNSLTGTVAERRPAALGDVVLAAAAAAERTGRGQHELARAQAAIARRVVDGHHNRGPVGRHPGHHDDAGPIGRDQAADVERQPPDAVRGGAIGHPVRHIRRPGDI